MVSFVELEFYLKRSLGSIIQILEEYVRHTWMEACVIWKEIDHIIMQGLTLSIWFTCPSAHSKKLCPAKIFTCPANICPSPVKLMYTAGKISTCPDWKINCPVEQVTTKDYVSWDNIYMPWAWEHALTLWGRDKMAAFFQTTFSKAFSSMKM